MLELENPRSKSEILSTEQKSNSVTSWEKLVLLIMQDGTATVQYLTPRKKNITLTFDERCAFMLHWRLRVDAVVLPSSYVPLDNAWHDRLSAVRAVIVLAYCKSFTALVPGYTV